MEQGVLLSGPRTTPDDRSYDRGYYGGGSDIAVYDQ